MWMWRKNIVNNQNDYRTRENKGMVVAGPEQPDGEPCGIL